MGEQKPFWSYQKVKDLPLADLQEFYENLDKDDPIRKQYDMSTIIGHLEHHGIYHLRLAAYLEAREDGLSHEGAVKKQNKVATNARKGLGYFVTHDINF